MAESEPKEAGADAGQQNETGFNNDADFYSMLNVPKTASMAEIGKSYRKVALSLHPDK